jgi:TldD protein
MEIFFSLHEILGGLLNAETLYNEPEKFHPKIDELVENLTKKTHSVYAKPGITDVVISNKLGGILIHEAIGHAAEADNVMQGADILEKNSSTVANSLVSITDFAHTAFDKLCPEPIYIDDEGVLAKDAVLIEKGKLAGLMHNRQSAYHYKKNTYWKCKSRKFHRRAIN